MDLLLNLALIITLLICVYTDVREKIIYNKVLFPSIIFAILLHLLNGGLGGLAFGVKGFVVGLGVLFIPFALGGIGAGDVKLLAAIGTYKGWIFIINATLYGLLIGGVIIVVSLIRQKRLAETLINILIAFKNLVLLRDIKVLKTLDQADEQDAFPYGVPLALGTVLNMILGG